MCDSTCTTCMQQQPQSGKKHEDEDEFFWCVFSLVVEMYESRTKSKGKNLTLIMLSSKLQYAGR